MKKQKEQLTKQADELHKGNVEAVQHLRETVKVIDASRYSNNNDLQTAIAQQLSEGYKLNSVLNSLLIFVWSENRGCQGNVCGG